jgi:hypothetical protein
MCELHFWGEPLPRRRATAKRDGSTTAFKGCATIRVFGEVSDTCDGTGMLKGKWHPEAAFVGMPL